MTDGLKPLFDAKNYKVRLSLSERLFPLYKMVGFICGESAVALWDKTDHHFGLWHLEILTSD
jgi:hypothetical protein